MIDRDGFVQLNGHKIHIDILRDPAATAELLGPMVGVTAHQLQRWARGPGLPLGLPWTDWKTPAASLELRVFLERENVNERVTAVVLGLDAERQRYRAALAEIAGDLGHPSRTDESWCCAMDALGKDKDAAIEAWHD